MKLGVSAVDDVYVLTPHGMLLGEKETEEIQAKVKELDQNGNTKLLLNLSQTTFMSSLGMAALFIAHMKYSKRNATVKICCVERKIMQVFELVKLPLVYDGHIHETEDEALNSFRSMKGTEKP